MVKILEAKVILDGCVEDFLDFDQRAAHQTNTDLKEWFSKRQGIKFKISRGIG